MQPMWIQYHFHDDEREYIGLFPLDKSFFLTCYDQDATIDFNHVREFICHHNEHEFIYSSLCKKNRDIVFNAFCEAVVKPNHAIAIEDMGYVKVIVQRYCEEALMVTGLVDS